MVRIRCIALVVATILGCTKLLAQCPYPVTPVTNTLFVKTASTGTGDGSSWDNAFDGHYLAKFLRETALDGTKVYVAAGTYIPYQAGCDDPASIRTYTFDLKKNVEFRGGYDPASTGTEVITNRNPKTFVTRLSAEVQGDANQTNNAYHVVVIERNVSPVVEGFYISDGYANNSSVDGAQNGGGILDYGGQNSIVRLSQLVLENNTANYGAAIYFDGNMATVGDNLILRNNQAFTLGAIFAWGDFGLFNTTISGTQGSGIVSWEGNILLRNVTISGNHGNGIQIDNVRSGELKVNFSGATITNNTAAGISLHNNVVDKVSMVLVNSLVVNNNGGSTAVNQNITASGSFPIVAPTFRHNIVGDSLFIESRANRIKLTRSVDLGPLAANGGWGDTHALLNPCTNPAVNTGDMQLLSDPFTTGLDQRNVPRSNPPCIGAYDGVNGILLSTLTSPATTVCGGENASISALALFPGSPVVASYQWKKDGAILGGQTASTLQLNNLQPTDAGKYTVEVTRDGSCTRESDTVFFSVKTAPTVVQPSNQTLCSTTATVPVTLTGSIPQTVFTWTNDHPEIGLPASGTGDIPAFTANNTTSNAITATITITPTFDGCTGIAQSFTITVEPTPLINTVNNQFLCVGSNTIPVSLTGNVTGATYSWTNDRPDIGLAANGTGDIPAFTVLNTTNAAIVATITVNVTASGCPGTSSHFTITVNPIPSVNAVVSQTVCAGTSTAAINFAGSVAATQYSWTNDHPEVGLAATGAGNISAFVPTNTSSAPIVCTIVVTPSANACTGLSTSFTITVNPMPNFVLNASATICEGETVANLSYTNPNEPTLNYSIIFNSASRTAGFQNVTNIALPASPIVITVPAAVPAASYGGQLVLQNTYGCQSISYPFTITIVPQTKITNQPRPNIIVCEGTAYVLGVVATGANLQYQWYKDGQAVAGAIKSTYTVLKSKVEEAGVYYVIVTGTCGAVQSSNTRVWINRPDWLLQKWNDVLIVDNTCNCVVSYQWIKNAKLIEGATKQFYSEEGGLDGTYYALITLNDGSQFLTCEWTVLPKFTGDAKVYPNPVNSNGMLTLDLGTDAQGEHTVELYDLSGKLRKQIKQNGSTFSVPIGLPQGIYVMRVSTSKGPLVQKIVVR